MRFSFKYVWVVGFAMLLALGAAAYTHLRPTPAAVVQYKTPEEADVYVRFGMEAYDTIKEHYWMKTTEGELATLFQLSVAKAANMDAPPTLATTTRADVSAMLGAALAVASSTDAKKDLILRTVQVALYNLAPAGRDMLLSGGQEVALRQEVANVKPEHDLYQDLGVVAGAAPAAVESAYQEKKATLEKTKTPEAAAELKKVSYAKEVLTNATNKALYDEAKVEPTIFVHRLDKTLYLNISKIAPTTLQEFGNAILAASTTQGLESLILDVRGNAGGALDFAPYFLGLFIGPNQFAFDFFHQGDYQPQRTPTPKFGELDRYKEVVVLVDNMTQSTAEVLAAMFKRFHLGVVVGGKTRGWGTVENTVPFTTVIDPAEKYSMLLVQYITLRDDGQPIEGRGVDPSISISDKNWQSQLPSVIHSSSLRSTVIKIVSKPPLR